MSQSGAIQIVYDFAFPDGGARSYTVALDRATLSYLPSRQESFGLVALEAMQAGADDYIPKPFSGRELIARVTSHVRMTRIRRAAVEQELDRVARSREVAVGEQIVRHGRQELVGVEVGDGLRAVPAGVSAEGSGLLRRRRQQPA